MKSLATLHKKALYYIPILLLLSYLLIKSHFFILHDFSTYYFSALFLVENTFSTATYDALSFNEAIVAKGYEQIFAAYYPNTPFIAAFFLPFTLFSPHFAKILFVVLTVILFLWTLNKCFNYFSIPSYYLLLFPILFFTSLKSNVLFGQVYLLLFSLLMLGFIAFEQKKWLLSSFFWSITILLKVFPILIFFFLLLKKKYTAFLYLAICCTILLLLSCLFTGTNIWIYFFNDILPSSMNGQLYDGFTAAAKSALMLFKNLFVYDQLVNPQPFINSYCLFLIVQIIYKTLIISCAVLVSLSQKNNLFTAFSVWILAAMLLTPNGSSYSGILLFIPLFAYLQQCSNFEISKKSAFVLLVVLAISNVPNHLFSQLPLLLKFPRFYLLLLFLIIFYFSFVEKRATNLLAVIIVLVLFTILATPNLFQNNKLDKSNYVLNNEQHILISDYEFKNKQLVYKYWTKDGKKSFLTNINIQQSDSNYLSVQNNQIYFKNQPLTTSSDLKRQPTLVNGTDIFYLSDKNRGYGFYTLRKIDFPTQ